MNPLEINVLVLAYLGDVIFEEYVRRFLIKKGISNVKDLQTEAIKYVSAKGQKYLLMKLLDDNVLTEEEIAVMKRARNSKVNHHPKNCDIQTYNYATGFEAIFGYLDISGNSKRIEELMNIIFAY